MINGPGTDRHLDLLWALVSSSLDPTADVGSMIVALDRVAESCAASFEDIIETLFSSGAFAGDNDDYHDPRNSLLHEVLARQTGMPITLSVVAMEVGKRLAVPIVGVGLPGHFVVRDKQSGTFADPFAHGLRFDQQGIVESWQRRMGGDAEFRPSLLAPTSARDIVLRILNNLKFSLVTRDNTALLARLAPLRAAFPELIGERDEHRRWLRHFN